VLNSTSTLVIISVGRLLQGGIDPWIMGAVLRFRPCSWKKKRKKRKKRKEPKTQFCIQPWRAFVFYFPSNCVISKIWRNFPKIAKLVELTPGKKNSPKFPKILSRKRQNLSENCNHCGSNCFLKIITFIAPVVLRFSVPLYVGSFKTCWSNN